MLKKCGHAQTKGIDRYFSKNSGSKDIDKKKKNNHPNLSKSALPILFKFWWYLRINNKPMCEKQQIKLKNT